MKLKKIVLGANTITDGIVGLTALLVFIGAGFVMILNVSAGATKAQDLALKWRYESSFKAGLYELDVLGRIYKRIRY
jgi:hypothetical protein